MFAPKSVTVYPDESVKPTLGHGLNKRALCALISWPVDKATGAPVRDSPAILHLHKQRLQKASKRMGVVFKARRSVHLPRS